MKLYANIMLGYVEIHDLYCIFALYLETVLINFR
jgi:hypothetical protein